MKKLKTLKKFKEKVDIEIEKYFYQFILDIKKKDFFIADAIKHVKKIVLSGGKRLRPAFMYYGYLASGGKEREKIIKASVSIELTHSFLLIHDDIIDCDNKRHGLDSVGFRYEKISKKIFRGKDNRHFGNSVAIIIGDMVHAMGNEVIYNSEFSAENKIRAIARLQEIIWNTVIGESQDVYIEYMGNASEEEVLKMYENKTARYTIEGPLQLGALLNGADEKFLKNLSSYALPIGTAFQIQDDILGIFGSESKLGKNVGSDISEGKQTLLVAKAKEKADKNQKAILKNVLGKKDLAEKDIEDFKKVIVETGALKYSNNLAKKLILKGKQALDKLEIEKEAKDFLNDVADFMIEREI